jgi:hypothetical protein
MPSHAPRTPKPWPIPVPTAAIPIPIPAAIAHQLRKLIASGLAAPPAAISTDVPAITNNPTNPAIRKTFFINLSSQIYFSKLYF